VSSVSKRPDPTIESLRVEARSIFGRDAAGYDVGRPAYPERVYKVLTDRCGLRAGISVLECGPGTGQVTRHLISAGARVVAVEPDPAMGEFLLQSFADKDVQVVTAAFEEAPVDEGSFDLAVAATSFHWVDQEIGLPKLGRALRPGGWAALWWTIFADPDRPDPFHQAACDLLGEDPGRQMGTSRFQLDREQRRSDLVRLAGLIDVESECLPWMARMNPAAVRALYASMINVKRLAQPEQERVLTTLETVAAADFGGVVERPFMTVLYTARKP
jgi:SAM-dependent methyltransferase